MTMFVMFILFAAIMGALLSGILFLMILVAALGAAWAISKLVKN